MRSSWIPTVSAASASAGARANTSATRSATTCLALRPKLRLQSIGTFLCVVTTALLGVLAVDEGKKLVFVSLALEPLEQLDHGSARALPVRPSSRDQQPD